ncbi:MAG: methionine--tRNA ligase [Pseudomonadota bacterium]
MSDKSPYYITTAISYPNGIPHIGHAYEMVATDALARFKRLDGHPTYFLTGTDEHGQKMLKTAREENIPVAELAKRNSDAFETMVQALNGSNDDFLRTSQERHHKASQAIWAAMAQNETDGKPDIYKDSYAGWYSVRDEAYYGEEETQIVDGVRVGAQGTPVEWVEEESYFFRLSAYQDRLLELYEANSEFISPPNRLNEIRSFVKSGLRDLSISRTTFDWGVPVPGDERHVMYVWVDALTNYLTGLGYPEKTDLLDTFWPCDVHVIGKDIVRFHTVYWPAFLMSAGIELPKRVFGHGFLLNRGKKMSKSAGNVVDPITMAETYGVDQIRYYFLREVAFGQDGSYSHEMIVNRINADLANDLGNLAQRSLSMIFKNLDGVIGEISDLTAEDLAILDTTDALLETARKHMDDLHPHLALSAIWDVIGDANRYFAAQEPWALKKTDPHRMASVLAITAEIIRQSAILSQPFMPDSSSKLLDLLKVDEADRGFASLGPAGRIASGTVIDKPVGVFPRFVDQEADAS